MLIHLSQLRDACIQWNLRIRETQETEVDKFVLNSEVVLFHRSIATY